MSKAIPNIRHLAAFAATARHGSVTRAAEEIALTQPALTQAIGTLERALDCQLFEREPGGMRPTEPALLLAPRVEIALRLIGSPRVTATQLRAFVALARKGSYAAASEAAGVSAASLHRAVADLSLALGERLVERKGRHLVLTGKGQARARKFGLALAELRAGYAEISAWLGKAGERIVIGALPLSRARWLPRALVAFRKRRSNVAVSVIEGSHAELAGPLRDGEIDFLLGALRQEESIDDLEQIAAFADRPQIMMSAQHPLAEAPRILPQDLLAYPWTLPAPRTPLRTYWEEMMLACCGRVPDIDIECGSVLTIREFMLETDFLTLLSPDQLRVEIAAGTHVSRAPPRLIERTIGITTRKDWRPTSAQREMIALLHSSAKHIS
ncbi:LysR family transcriptional regulator [Pelagerythrobacter marensis]|uniref:LysR family transcriptional regulator n=1 Tax=Pelagerythrobacter marensis TaxID=543877 RepID=A0ABZ2D6K1_9SPHN